MQLDIWVGGWRGGGGGGCSHRGAVQSDEPALMQQQGVMGIIISYRPVFLSGSL